MKKVFKKATATVTAAAMLASLTACGGGAASSATTAAPAADSKAEGGAETTEAAASGIDNKDIKIGVSIWSSTDVLGSQCKLILDEAAKALVVQVQYVDQGHVSEKVTASVEQLAAAGCQGIIICNSSDTEMTSAIKTANDNKVYLAQFFREIARTTAQISTTWQPSLRTTSVQFMRTSRRTARNWFRSFWTRATETSV